MTATKLVTLGSYSKPSFSEGLDRVLDKGIVIEALARLETAGIDLITVETRVVITSIETNLRYVEV